MYLHKGAREHVFGESQVHHIPSLGANLHYGVYILGPAQGRCRHENVRVQIVNCRASIRGFESGDYDDFIIDCCRKL